MRTKEKERFLRMNYTEEELEIRDKLYKNHKLARYKIRITEEKDNHSLMYYANHPAEGYYIDTVYFYRPDQFDDILTLYEGLFYELFDLISGKRIGYGTLDPDSPVEEIRETIKECCGICEMCFWRGMLYGEDKEEAKISCYKKGE